MAFGMRNGSTLSRIRGTAMRAAGILRRGHFGFDIETAASEVLREYVNAARFVSRCRGSIVHTSVANEMLKKVDDLCCGFVMHVAKRTLRAVDVKDAQRMCETLLDLGTT